MDEQTNLFCTCIKKSYQQNNILALTRRYTCFTVLAKFLQKYLLVLYLLRNTKQKTRENIAVAMKRSIKLENSLYFCVT